MMLAHQAHSNKFGAKNHHPMNGFKTPEGEGRSSFIGRCFLTMD